MGAMLAHKPFLQNMQKSDSYVSQSPPAPWQWMLHCQGAKARPTQWELPRLTPSKSGSSWSHFPVAQSWMPKGTNQKMMGTPAQPRGCQTNRLLCRVLRRGRQALGQPCPDFHYFPPCSYEHCALSCCICYVHHCWALHSILCRGTCRSLMTTHLYPVLLVGKVSLS